MSDKLLIKFIAGETSAEENKAIKLWIAADKVHKKRFAHVNFIWKVSKSVDFKGQVNQESAWQRFKSKIG